MVEGKEETEQTVRSLPGTATTPLTSTSSTCRLYPAVFLRWRLNDELLHRPHAFNSNMTFSWRFGTFVLVCHVADTIITRSTARRSTRAAAEPDDASDFVLPVLVFLALSLVVPFRTPTLTWSIYSSDASAPFARLLPPVSLSGRGRLPVALPPLYLNLARSPIRRRTILMRLSLDFIYARAFGPSSSPARARVVSQHGPQRAQDDGAARDLRARALDADAPTGTRTLPACASLRAPSVSHRSPHSCAYACPPESRFLPLDTLLPILSPIFQVPQASRQPRIRPAYVTQSARASPPRRRGEARPQGEEEGGRERAGEGGGGGWGPVVRVARRVRIGEKDGVGNRLKRGGRKAPLAFQNLLESQLNPSVSTHCQWLLSVSRCASSVIESPNWFSNGFSSLASIPGSPNPNPDNQ
ncbi:hypothetical protein K438DRAFT_1773175 [Mycena galopus ATCC 62051]|nr:hypothetical protein K438DRAFT_1773175 [Mycena galopus ATCC 62051]